MTFWLDAGVFHLPTASRAAVKGGGSQKAVKEKLEGSTWHGEITLVIAGLKFLSVMGG